MSRWATTISGEINVEFIRNFYFLQERSRPTVSQFSILSFLLQVLVSFLELKYQGKNFSSFEAHPAITFTAIASFFLYCFACYNELRLTSDHRFAVLFGCLSSVSLASILYPDFSPLLFLLYVLFLVGVLLNSRLQGLWNWVSAENETQSSPRTTYPGLERGSRTSLSLD